MSNSFEIIERVGVSKTGVSDAVSRVVKEAHAEKPVSWFEVAEQRGRVTSSGDIEFQVTVKIGRTL